MALGFTPVVELYGTNAALFNERLLNGNTPTQRGLYLIN